MIARPNWVQEEFQRRTKARTETLDEIARERYFQKAAISLWERLLEEARADVEEFAKMDGSAQFQQTSEFEFRVRRFPLTLVAEADIANHTIRYHYESSGEVAAPVGGIFSIRLSRYGRAVLFSADERLNSEEARRMLLEPALFPED